VRYLAIEQALNDRWPKVEFRRVARIRRETNSRSEETLLALSAYTGVRPRPEDGGNQLPSEETITGYWVARPGDLVFNPMWALEGGVAVSEYRGALSTAYRVYDLGPAIAPRFAHYYFRSRPAIEQYRLMVRGLTTFDRSVSREDFEGMPMPLPPLEEQRSIAEYLDTETSRIDALISKKQQMVELLDERLDAFIDEQVARFSESSPIKRVAKIRYGLGQPPETSETGSPILRATNIDRGTITVTDMIYADRTVIPWDRCPPLEVGEILVVRSGALTGDSAIISEEWAGSAPGYDLRLTPQSIVPAFLAFQLLGGQAFRQIELVRGRAAQPHLNAEDLGEVVVKRGTASEEQRVAQVLKNATIAKNEMSKMVNQQLLLLGERRQALITAAVTGQLEILEVAA
jgi:hypothetical protein